MLKLGAGLMIFAAVVFALTQNFWLLTSAAVIGVISPSGNEIGPFLSIEQASLTQLTDDKQRTRIFAWYNLIGSFATALGALAGGGLSQQLQALGIGTLESYRWVVLGYGVVGAVLLLLFQRLSSAVELLPATSKLKTDKPKSILGLHRSKKIVFRLAALFSLDAFAGGFVIQSLIAYWFHVRFGVEPGFLGAVFFGANLLAGVSALSAAHIARRIGLINTMVFTHLPSNVLLILVPLMPNLQLAVAMLWLRYSISQMDVPTRQSYTMAVVDPDERSAASGVTNVARTIGASLSPSLTGLFLSNPALLSLPFIIGGGLKIIYDLALYISFKKLPPPEEKKAP
jgi:MFS family permease